jgi:phosphopantetheinyl transferase
VEFARSKIGEGGYNIIHNNCEHFATLAVLGERACAQADSVRALFKSLPLLDVYVARIPSDEIDLSSIASAKRRAYIEAASNESVRRERYFVWRLLEYAVQRTFGKRLADLSAVQTASGAWQLEGVELSLTHTDGVVAVAVSRSAVGVDIEHEATERVEKLAGKILTESERVELDAITAPEGARSYIIERWCMKESIFKKSGEGAFVPSSVDTARGGALVRRISVGTESLVLAVASDHPDRLRLYEDVDIS